MATAKKSAPKKSAKPAGKRSKPQPTVIDQPKTDSKPSDEDLEFERIRQQHEAIEENNGILKGLPGTGDDKPDADDEEPGTQITDAVKAFALEHGLTDEEAFQILSQQGLPGAGDDKPEGEEVFYTGQGESSDDDNGLDEEPESKPKKKSKNTFTFTATDEEAAYIEAVLKARIEAGLSENKNHFLRQAMNVGLNNDFDIDSGRVTDDTLKMYNPVPKVYFKNV